MRADAQPLVLESDTTRQLFGHGGQQALARSPPVEVGHLLGSLLDVAEVGEEDAYVGPDHGGAGRPREAGRPAEIRSVRDHERVEALRADGPRQTIGLAHAGPSRCVLRIARPWR